MFPPNDVPASELFLKLKEGEPSEVVDFPRYDSNGEPVGRVRVRVLTQEDHDTARLEAEKAMLARGVKREDLRNPATQEVLADSIARELLAMACLTETGPDVGGKPQYGRIFRNAKDLKRVRPDEIATLFAAYQLVQFKFGPYERLIESDEELTAWIKRLEEGASEFPLLALPLPRLARLTWLLAHRAYTLCALLESQWESLPDTLKSSLAGFSMGTGSFTAPVDSDTAIGGASSDDDDPVTIEAAAAMAEDLKYS